MTTRQLTRDELIRIAKVQLFEARRTIHRDWRITLLGWAGERRRRAAALSKHEQLSLL